MIKLIIIIGILILAFVLPFWRSIIFHPINTVRYGCTDVFHFFYDKLYNRCEVGVIDMYCGLFGSGKTVSMIQRIYSNYKRFNGKFIRIDGKLVPVKINVLSNVELKGIPYTDLKSMQQLVDWTKYAPEHRNEWLLVAIDEASVILNARSFASNLDFGSINSFLTCRHFNMCCYLTSQRFALTDKLLRSVTQRVFQCRKIWRVIIHDIYDAYEVENATHPQDVKPKLRRSIFCTDKVFKCYDTLATVSDIVKKTESGDMLSEKEIIDRIQGAVTEPPRKKLRRKDREK